MSDAQRMVTEFHRAFDIVIGTTPAVPDEATCALRVNLIQEEFDEVRVALAQRDVEAVAKELADLLYVVYGTAVSCGLDMDPVFQEVHRSNMSKVGGRKRADGKWLKPSSYSPACLHPILAAQGLRAPQDAGGATPSLPPAGADLQDRGPAAPPPMSQNEPRGWRKRQSRTRMDEIVAVQCPQCRKNFVRRSHRRGFKERLFSLMYIYPFRCYVCGHRFKALRFRVRYEKRLIDRRQYERIPTHIPTTCTESVKPGEYRVGQGVVTDLSLGGCYLHTVVRLLEGALVSLELQVYDQAQAIMVEAAIVRSVRPTGIGLEFLRVSDTEHERLSHFLRQLLTAQPATAPAAQST
jgi:predicted HAD superfamily Cof-like phosphohydrolase